MTEWASDDGRIRLIHGDCRKKIHTIAWPISADALITDPPYGIGMDGRKQDTSKHGGHKGYKFKKWDSAPPDARTFQYLREFPVCVIWGANYFSRHLPAKSGWLVWDKGQRIDNSDGELAWTNQDRALRILTLNRVALMQDGAIHPTQKPVALMEWCMDVVKVPKNALVYDPYMGSGSTGVACIRTGRRFLGYEADEEYFEGAKQRIIRELAQPFMPGLEPSRQVQPSLI